MPKFYSHSVFPRGRKVELQSASQKEARRMETRMYRFDLGEVKLDVEVKTLSLDGSVELAGNCCTCTCTCTGVQFPVIDCD